MKLYFSKFSLAAAIAVLTCLAIIAACILNRMACNAAMSLIQRNPSNKVSILSGNLNFHYEPHDTAPPRPSAKRRDNQQLLMSMLTPNFLNNLTLFLFTLFTLIGFVTFGVLIFIRGSNSRAAAFGEAAKNFTDILDYSDVREI